MEIKKITREGRRAMMPSNMGINKDDPCIKSVGGTTNHDASLRKEVKEPKKSDH